MMVADASFREYATCSLCSSSQSSEEPLGIAVEPLGAHHPSIFRASSTFALSTAFADQACHLHLAPNGGMAAATIAEIVHQTNTDYGAVSGLASGRDATQHRKHLGNAMIEYMTYKLEQSKFGE